MLRSLIFIQCVFLLATATKIPIRTSPRKSPARHHPKRLVQRDGGADTNVTLNDEQDRIYTVDITVAGTSYEAQIDSGSSDLWISTTPNNLKTLNDTGIPANLTYGVGFAAGTIAVGTVEFSGEQIARQAYVAATDVNNPITSLSANSLLGTGFTQLSLIDATINATGGSWGRSLFFNLFALDPTTANYMAVTLSRDDDPDSNQVGSISISEIDPDFSGVLQTPRISTFPVIDALRWTVLVDSIIVGGSAISTGASIVTDAPSGKTVGLLDTGTSYIYASTNVVNQIYAGVSGASFSSALGTWIIPCDAEIDVTIAINGRNFFLHPLDVSIPTLSDNTTCQGTWIPASFSGGENAYDILFGVAMLRSVLAVYNYGDFKDDLSLDDPYVQLFSLVTNGTQASEEFRAVRGGDTQAKSSFPNNAGVNDPSSSSSSSSSPSSPSAQSTPDLLSIQTKVDRIYSFAPALFALAALNIVLLLIIAGWFCLRLTRRRKRKSSKSRNKALKSPGIEEPDPLDPEGGSYIALSRPNASTTHGPYRPVSTGETLRDSGLYDSPSSSKEKPFHYDSVKNVDDDADLPLPRPRAPALRNSYRPLSSGSTLRDSRLYDAPNLKSPGYDKYSFDIPARVSTAYDQIFSPSNMTPTTAVDMPPNAMMMMLNEPLVSIHQTAPSANGTVAVSPILEQSPIEPHHHPEDPSAMYTQDITAQSIPMNDPVLIPEVEGFEHNSFSVESTLVPAHANDTGES